MGGSATTTWPTGASLRLVDIVPRPGHLLQDAARMIEQALARLGRRGAPPVSQQQVLAQLHLQAADLPADRRLGDPEQPSRAAESAEVDDVHEILELFQVHAHSAPLPQPSAFPC